MPRHRDFSIERFVAAVSPELVGRLVTALGGAPLPPWPTLNGLALDEWLRDSEQADVEALIRQQMRRINDLAERNMQILIRAYTHVGMTLDPNTTPEAAAVTLFLECPDGFEYAWSRYLLYANVTDLGDYYFPAGTLSPDAERREKFKRAVRDWCDGQSRGEQCRVQVFEDRDELIVLVQRGHWVRTVSYFPEGSDEVAFHRFRPAIDDLIVYEPATGMLRVKSSSAGDREAYVWHFGLHLARREDLIHAALHERIWTLEPFQSGTFDYKGDARIRRVVLARAKVSLGARSTLEIRSDDVNRELAGRDELSLRSGALLAVSLIFILVIGGKEHRLRIELTPPARSRIPDHPLADYVLAYLVAQGVKLR